MENFKLEDVARWVVKDNIAEAVNPYNEKMQYGYESFLLYYTNSERTKILKLHGHERIVDTPTTIEASYELEYNCHSKACSNCSGISCSAIFVPNRQYYEFDKWAKANRIATQAANRWYDASEFDIVWQYFVDDKWFACQYKPNDIQKAHHNYRQFLRLKQPVEKQERKQSEISFIKSQFPLVSKLLAVKNNTYDLGLTVNKRLSWERSFLKNLNKEGIYLTASTERLYTDAEVDVLIKSKSGVEFISLKRSKQLSKHGYDAEHDEQHTPMQFINAAKAYMYRDVYSWTFDHESFKLSDDIENLANAGAMLAAAIDLIKYNDRKSNQ